MGHPPRSPPCRGAPLGAFVAERPAGGQRRCDLLYHITDARMPRRALMLRSGREETGMAVTINCDMGEGYGIWRMGDDEACMPYVTHANIACGFHASDPMVMWKTV